MGTVSPELFANKFVELLGGVESARIRLDAEYESIRRLWDQPTSDIGRILRAHLFVEHYMGEHLRVVNPRLGCISRARLSFAQKLALLGDMDACLTCLIPGIRHLNKIRNRLAHNLGSRLTIEDSAIFLGISPFRALREALAQPNLEQLSDEPISVLEDFSKLAGNWLGASSRETTPSLREAIEHSLR